MTHTNLEADAPVGAASRPGLVATAGEILALFAAAVRAARAVEARREPARTDLEVLGIRGKLPPAW